MTPDRGRGSNPEAQRLLGIRPALTPAGRKSLWIIVGAALFMTLVVLISQRIGVS